MLKSKYRFLYMILAGTGIFFLLHFLVPIESSGKNIFFSFITTILITITVWEGNLHLDIWMDKKFPWLQKPGRRILIHLPSSIVYSAGAIYFIMLLFDKYLCQIPPKSKEMMEITSVSVGVIISITILAIEIGTQFFRNWKNSLVEVEKYKAESLSAQLQNLKDQINPHFLFNNLSVLSSLVYKDPDKSVDFINQLSKVYRYLLDNKNTELVSLEQELKFIRSYTYLIQIRFDKNIEFIFSIPDDQMQLLLPPMALQMLVENAIKHNEVSSEFPLLVSISVSNGTLEIKNNLQPRSTEESSSKTGFQNIRQRYSYFTDRKVEIIRSEKHFIVKLPLLATA